MDLLHVLQIVCMMKDECPQAKANDQNEMWKTAIIVGHPKRTSIAAATAIAILICQRAIFASFGATAAAVFQSFFIVFALLQSLLDLFAQIRKQCGKIVIFHIEFQRIVCILVFLFARGHHRAQCGTILKHKT